MEKIELFKLALKAKEEAYAPYSKFHVGAIITCKDGSIFKGFNIENASYSLSMCAERNAIFNAYLNEKTIDDIETLTVVSDNEEPVSICGACRQVLSELFPKNGKIYLFGSNGKMVETNIDELLPGNFKKEDLIR